MAVGDVKNLECKQCTEGFAWVVVRGKSPDYCSQDCRTEFNRAYLRAYYVANKAKYIVTDPVKIAANRERVWRRNQDPAVREAKNAAQRAAYRRSPEQWKAGAMRRRARQSGAPVNHFTEKDWRRIVARQSGRCHYCDEKAVLTKEHLIPLARGGAHSVGNIVGACATCNHRKHTRTRMEYLVWLDRKAVA